jgi:hypothetical protein
MPRGDEASKRTGRSNPVSFTFSTPNGPAARPLGVIPPTGPASGVIPGRDRDGRTESADQHRLGWQVPGSGLASSGRPGSELHLLEHDHREFGLAVDQHGPQRRPADREGAADRPPEHRPSQPRRRVPDGEQAPGPGTALSVDRPGGLGDRRDPSVQDFNNPTTLQGSTAYGKIGGSIWPTQIWMSGRAEHILSARVSNPRILSRCPAPAYVPCGAGVPAGTGKMGWARARVDPKQLKTFWSVVRAGRYRAPLATT